MDMTDYRSQIDTIDTELASLLAKRLKVVRDIAAYKAKNNIPVYDPARERQKLNDLGTAVGEEMAPSIDALFSLIFDLSRSEQHRIIAGESPIKTKILQALANTSPQFPERPTVACQGVEGANSQMACDRIFPSGNIMYFQYFENVFSAVEQGLCRYGILPIENSTAGSVNRIYDLMTEHNCYIVRSCRVKIDHCLLANTGVSLSEIKEVISHEQALAQCQGFLKTLGVKVTPVKNTAYAAQMVRESGRRDLAALASLSCAELYGLNCLKSSVQDTGSNFTRFICIAKDLEIYPGADRTSLMVVTPHKRGALSHVLSRFKALNINLIKLESRPLANSDFEFMFYFDLETSVYNDAFLRLFDDLQGSVTTLKYLGTYSEVV
ncbi:MAG: prephenate dehydratase domain-containing protein [Pyramidobacter sp.]|nr:prephenate dehydratase domain-containing protein [Pyramidobacter sp.]